MESMAHERDPHVCLQILNKVPVKRVTDRAKYNVSCNPLGLFVPEGRQTAEEAKVDESSVVGAAQRIDAAATPGKAETVSESIVLHQAEVFAVFGSSTDEHGAITVSAWLAQAMEVVVKRTTIYHKREKPGSRDFEKQKGMQQLLP